MKSFSLKASLILVSICSLVLSSCRKDKCSETVTYTTYVPTYMSYDEMRSSVKSETPQALKAPGKIYLKGNYIFVNEPNKGIHVIDNSNPSSPQNVSFINIPGNVDLAAAGDVLYADSYVDLVAINISNPLNVSVLNRVQDALPYPVYSNGYYADPSKGVVKDWTQKQVTEKITPNCGNSSGIIYPMIDNYNGALTPNATNAGTTYSTSGSPGVGGSTARFTISANALYLVDNTTLHVYDITNNAAPSKVSDQNLGWSIETIFPYKSHLFIGSSSGVFIYDNSNPLSPYYVSEYSHITACDPVTVDDQYAYFTLSKDAPCHKGVDELDIVDITDLTNPTLKITVPMTNPKGIGIDAKTLFICDSNDGLKVYDATDVTQIASREIAHFSNINAFDVIPYNKHLLMIGSDGLYQYDYTNVLNITLLSKIPVQN